MPRIIAVIVISLLLLGCEHFSPRPGFKAVEAGMTPAQVAALVGSPLARHARDDLEAWQYCVTGWLVDDYVVVWFQGSTVIDKHIELDDELGQCSVRLATFSWDQAPGA